MSYKFYQALNGSVKLKYDALLASGTWLLFPHLLIIKPQAAHSGKQNNQLQGPHHIHIQKHILKARYLQ